MKKDRKKTDKEIWLIIGFLLFIFVTPVSAEFELGRFWSLNDDTIVLTNTSHNVNVGENDTTIYKLYVNGTVGVSEKITSAHWSFLDSINIFNNSQTFIEGIELGNSANDGRLAFEGTQDFLIYWWENLGILDFGYPPWSGLIRLNEDVQVSEDIKVSKDCNMLGNANLHGDLTLNGTIFLGDTERNISSDRGEIRVSVAGGLSNQFIVDVNGDTLLSFIKGLSPQGSIKINDAKGNYDLIVYGDAGNQIIRTDASTERMGILVPAPSHTLDVGGDFNANEIILPTSVPALPYEDGHIWWSGSNTTLLIYDINTAEWVEK